MGSETKPQRQQQKYKQQTQQKAIAIYQKNQLFMYSAWKKLPTIH
jgi:hypothetical protein